MIWFLFALGAAISDSWSKASQKWAIDADYYSKYAITVTITGLASLLLFLISYFFTGFPVLKTGFWTAIAVTGILNAITFPLLLKAYEIGEFSSVYSMILLSPVFLLATSFFFLGEVPAPSGVGGVLLTVFGLLIIVRGNAKDHQNVRNFSKGNWLGVLVALIWSASVNFDKLAAQYSGPFFAPAIGLIFIASGSFIYALYKKEFALNTRGDGKETKVFFSVKHYAILLVAALFLVLSNVLHNFALLAGPAAYTIAIKRLGILFGGFWGWVFFKEKDISRKLLGAGVAVAGVAMILLG